MSEDLIDLDTTSAPAEPPSYEEASVRPAAVLSQQKGRPTVAPATNFNAAWDAVELKKALGTGDKKTIARLLSKRSLSQRLEIVLAYKASTKKNLADEIKSKIGGNVKSIFLNLLVPIPELYCQQLKKTRNDGFIENVATAILTISTDFRDTEKTGNDDVLIEIMCTKSNAEIRKICATYQIMNGKRLEQHIREEKTGKFKKLLKILSAGSRDESSTTDPAAAKTQAEELLKSLTKTQTDEMAIIEILANKSYAQIKLICIEYQKNTGNCLEKDIKKNISDSLKDALIAIVRTSKNPLEYYARRINKAINNFQLDDRTLGRLIVTRCEIDLLDIKEEFNRIFRKTIKSSLKDQISGNYRRTLLLLLGDNLSLAS